MTDDLSWRALHIYLSNTARIEAYLRDEIAPRLAAFRPFCAGWFFIRYWEGGQHIRLRLRGLPPARFDALKAELEEAMAGYRSDDAPDREIYMASLSPELLATAIDGAGQFHEDGSVVELRYVPELHRYGGANAIEMNERMFERSSDLALKVVKDTDGMAQLRLAIARDLMLASAWAMTRQPAELAVFFDEYARFWQGMAGPNALDPTALQRAGEQSRPATLARLDALGCGKKTLSEIWYATFTTLIADHRDIAMRGMLDTIGGDPGHDSVNATIRSIVGSQLHMLNNRLGIGPNNEYALATMLAAALR